jgi:STE24 endopeptidase
MYNLVFWLIIAFVVLEFVAERWVSKLNASWFGKPIPEILSGVFDTEKYTKQQAYSLTNYRFGVLVASFSVLISEIERSSGHFIFPSKVSLESFPCAPWSGL